MIVLLLFGRKIVIVLSIVSAPTVIVLSREGRIVIVLSIVGGLTKPKERDRVSKQNTLVGKLRGWICRRYNKLYQLVIFG